MIYGHTCFKIKKRRRSSLVEKFTKVSDIVWVCWKAVITENILKEKWTNKNDFNDNYNLLYYYSEHNITTFQFFNFEHTIHLDT